MVSQFHVEHITSVTVHRICRTNGVAISAAQLLKLEMYVSLLLQANRSVNLISRQNEENVWSHQILHSISPAFLLDFHQIKNILDLGTGGGLPGIPLKIIFPSMDFTLVDSILKKVNVVARILQKLDLQGISIVCSRAEDLAKTAHHARRYDVVVSRGVAPLKKLIEWSAPLLTRSAGSVVVGQGGKIAIPPGCLLAFKGGEIRRELTEARWDKRVHTIHEFPLVFQGSEVVSLTDKKIVIVEFEP